MDYTGQSAINNFSPATLFDSLGINNWTSGYVYVDSSTLTISGTPDDAEFPITAYYAVLNADGTYTAGSGTLTNATTLSGTGFTDTTPLPTAVVISLGFSRYKPRHVRYFYPKSCFIPSTDSGVTYDPPAVGFAGDGSTLDFTGQWVRRSQSTGYKSRGPLGTPFDGPTPFVDGELATHVGDNAADTCITTDGATPIPSTPGEALLARVPYLDHFYRGKYSYTLEQKRLNSLKGISTGGTAHSLSDSTQNWWIDGINGSLTKTASGTITAATSYAAGPPVIHGSATVSITIPTTATNCDYTVTDATTGAIVLAGTSAVTGGSTSTTLANDGFTTAMIGDTVTMIFQGCLFQDTGTATSGSTTSLTDTAHITTGSTNPLYRWWSASRFIGFSNPSPYTDFVLTVSRTVVGITTTWKMPITSTTSGSGGVTFNFSAVAGLTVAAGDSWSVTEPSYEINKWENRILNMTDPSGIKYAAKITHSDNDTLFFGQVYDSSGTAVTPTIGAGWSYTIGDRRFGGVWQWDADGGLDGSGAWNIPAGNDIVRRGVPTPQPFRSDQTMNLPTIARDCGFVMIDDLMCVETFTEIQQTINALKATKRDPGWFACAVDSAGSLRRKYRELWRGC